MQDPGFRPGSSLIGGKVMGPAAGSGAVKIRPATPEDAAVIADIYADAVLNGAATFELEPPGPDEMARRMNDVAAGGYPWLVAASAATVVGYAYAAPYHRRPAYRWTVEDSVYIAPDQKGRGIGRALLEAVIAISQEKGYRQMVAVISDDKSMASVALHRGCGFAEVGRLPAVGWKHGRWLATIFMQRPLGAADAQPPADV